MVTAHLGAAYCDYFTKKISYDSSAPLWGPVGGWNNRTIFFLYYLNFTGLQDIVRCPVKFRYYVKFYGVR